LAGALLCAGLGAAVYETRVARLAVVVRPDAKVRLTPLDEGKEAFTVHDGAELRVLDQGGQWLLVSAGQQRRGWLARECAVLVP
jgi:hypothetical protein